MEIKHNNRMCRMVGGAQQSSFFLGLPNLKKLCCVTLSLQEEDEEPRSKQIKTCRELVLLYSDILASPALDSFNEITVVMAISFFQRGFLQAFGRRRSLQLGSPQCVFPGVLQCCVSYSLITRLAPSWNKAGLYLISGKDFLTECRRLNAVSMELSTSEGQLCISIETNTVRLPPTTLEDFGLPPLVLKRFRSDPDSVLDPSSTGGAVWCHVLPSMKKGQIITISRQLPKDGPFRTYRDLQNHWNSMYGYRLPELAEEAVIYCSIYFRLVGEKLFTYPLSCVRLQPVQLFPRVDLQGTLGSFLSDIRDGLQSVCGFPARLTGKPCYHTAGLNTAASAQVSSGEQVNLTTSSSIRPVLTQLPAPPPRPARPSFGSQPSACTPLSQQAGAQGLLGNARGFGGNLTQSQECRRSSSSFSSPASFSVSSGSHSAPSLSSSSSSSSSSLPLFQPASSSSSFSSVLPPLPPPLNPTPKLVPIFKNKHPSRHVNVALLRLQKQKEQLSRGGGGRVTLPAIGKNTPTSSTVSSLSSLPIPPPPAVPRFNRHLKPHSSAAPQPSSSSNHPKLKHMASLSPSAKPKPVLVLAPKPETKSKPRTKQNPDQSAAAAAETSSKAQEKAAKQPSDTSSRESSRGGVAFESKPKKSRAAIRDVDVEKMARSNQLSRLNSATLSSWLRGRGVLVSAKHKKEELMLKVMGCLAEA
ncbi:uncharacterized protein C18orf63 isoform X3 [Thunnus albacares]|uniref:uncharacterized protein C18orf63 isoform X3 n=2 Tax=Thunnus albacares TaxID=8236 RepID=UPI001CF65695|nr:uncharacterized protein C18orf63 isoform X3 [Thunnus albacares]